MKSEAEARAACASAHRQLCTHRGAVGAYVAALAAGRLHANWVARLTFAQPARALVLDVEVAGELPDVNPFDFFVEPDAATFPFTYAPAVAWALQSYAAARRAPGGTGERAQPPFPDEAGRQPR